MKKATFLIIVQAIIMTLMSCSEHRLNSKNDELQKWVDSINNKLPKEVGENVLFKKVEYNVDNNSIDFQYVYKTHAPLKDKIFTEETKTSLLKYSLKDLLTENELNLIHDSNCSININGFDNTGSLIREYHLSNNEIPDVINKSLYDLETEDVAKFNIEVFVERIQRILPLEISDIEIATKMYFRDGWLTSVSKYTGDPDKINSELLKYVERMAITEMIKAKEPLVFYLLKIDCGIRHIYQCENGKEYNITFYPDEILALMIEEKHKLPL